MDIEQFVRNVISEAPDMAREPCYTGVGSRETPEDVREAMTIMASILEDNGYTLRTGDARGADAAFRQGVASKENVKAYSVDDVNDKALELGKKYHPAWERVGSYGRKLHARNSFQVLGDDLDDPKPSMFLICWTPDGATSDDERSIDTGGTGQAISIADDFNIPVYNLREHFPPE